MQNRIKIFSQDVFEIVPYIYMMATLLLGCQCAKIAEEEQVDLRLWAHAYANKISASIVNYSLTHDMLLEVNSVAGLGYRMEYVSLSNRWVICDNSHGEIRLYPENGLHALRASSAVKDGTVSGDSIFSFKIDKPNDFLELRSLEVYFRAIPLANALAVERAHELDNALRQYSIAYTNSTVREQRQ